ncbi:branched-chain-amino-acid aminotransferase [Globodera pallida]|nr:branched-chain-amino-acid aminotransferase [Globodera pallida]
MKTLQPAKSILRHAARAMSSLSDGAVAVPIEQQPAESDRSTFYHKDLSIVRATSAQLQPKPLGTVDQLKFGHHFADHMMEVDWSDTAGWSRPEVCPLRNIQLHPGAKVLHYAIELFEGMKAYRGIDDRIRLFRPDMNMARMKRTAIRAALPDFDADELMKIIGELVRLDREWVPYSSSSSLYIRPTLIGTDPTLGVAHSRTAKLFVLTGPVGTFFPTGFQPIALFADPSYARAFPGGVGAYKMGCNYAPSILIGKQANELGCQQVLWLSGPDEKITEVGAMNIFVYWRNECGELELVTPPLNDGLILPGVVRDSVLLIAREWGEFRVTERYPTMAELRRALHERRLLQMFGCGTACVISPIGRIAYVERGTGRVEDMQIPTMVSKATVMQRLYETINDIQYGRMDRPEWIRIVD